MPDLDFPDLARRAAETTTPPAFEAIVGRAHRRRRQQGITWTMLLVVAVLAVAVGTHLVDRPDAAPEPAKRIHVKPAPINPLKDGTLNSYAVDGHGDLLTIWTTCPRGLSPGVTCHYSWRLVAKRADFTGSLPVNSNPGVTSGTDDFAVTGDRGLEDVIDPDGTVHPLRRVPAGAVSPEAIPAGSTRDTPVLVDPATNTYFPLRDAQGHELTSAIVQNNTVWGEWNPELSNQVTLEWRTGGGPWHGHRLSGHDTVWGPIAVWHNRVAAEAGGIATDYNPMDDFSVSTNGGGRWVDLDKHQVPFPDVVEMAATRRGTLFVHSLVGPVYRSTDSTWTHFVKVKLPDSVFNFERVPGGVGMTENLKHDRVRLVIVDDGGHLHPWPTPLR